MCFMGCNNDGWKKEWSSLETKNEKNFVEFFCKKRGEPRGLCGRKIVMKFWILKKSNKKEQWDGYEVHGLILV